MTDMIHQINNYKSRYDFRDLFSILEIEQEVLDDSLIELNNLVAKNKIALLTYKKKKNKENVELYKNSYKACKAKEKEFEAIVCESGIVDNLKSTTNHNFFNELISKIGVFTIAKRLHGNSLKEMFKIIDTDKALIEKVDKELRNVNISYKQARYLVLAILNNNEAEYLKVCEIMEKNFLKLSGVMVKTDFENAIIGCLRGDIYITGNHSSFDRIHNSIYFPEIYLIKFAISKALN